MVIEIRNPSRNGDPDCFDLTPGFSRLLGFEKKLRIPKNKRTSAPAMRIPSNKFGFFIIKKPIPVAVNIAHKMIPIPCDIAVIKPPKRRPNKPFRMPVSGAFKIRGVGDVITGRIEQGTLRPNQMVQFSPSGATGKAFSIEMHHKNVESASHGDNVGVNVKNLKKENMPHVGDIMTLVDDNVGKSVLSFKAVVSVQDHPGQLFSAQKEGKGGFTPSVHVRTTKSPCRLEKIHWKMGKSTGGKYKEEDPLFIEKGDNAEVTFIPKMPFYVESFGDCPGLGRIAVMDSNNLVMLGKIMSVIYKD